jgi:iron complex outermembrane recepter protein
VLGANGKLDWLSYEVSWTHGRFQQSLNATGLVTSATNPNLNATTAAQAALYENLTGKSCVAINPLGQITSQAALNYIFNNQHQDSYLGQHVFAANFSGSSVTLWAGDLTLAAGAEYRRETLTALSDALGGNSLYSFGNFPSFSGRNEVVEGYGEIGLPLLRDKPLAHLLSVDAAVRHTDYKISGAVKAIRMRATWSRDIRAPSLNDLFFVGGGRQTTLTNMVSPACTAAQRRAGYGQGLVIGEHDLDFGGACRSATKARKEPPRSCRVSSRSEGMADRLIRRPAWGQSCGSISCRSISSPLPSA